MADQPEITVHKVTYAVSVVVTGTDAAGRTTVVCPFCHDDSYVDPADGRIVCPTGEMINTFLNQMWEEMT